jgi:hypothetical protein
MGINKFGNTQKIQKTEVESLMDFRELSIHKSNRVITKNFASFVAGSEPSISRLITFLIFESRRNNSIEFNTHLLVKYGKYIKSCWKKFDYKEKTREFKNTSLPISRSDFSLLISIGLIIPINAPKKLFLLNPALTYHENCYNEQAAYMRDYEVLYNIFAAQLISKKDLNSKLIELGRNYYMNCITKDL